MPRKDLTDHPEPAAAGPSAEEDDIDTVPDAVRNAARAAFAMRDSAADVLELTYDSAFDKGASRTRRLSFGVEDGASVVELEVTEDGDRRRLLVSCALGDAELVAVESPRGRSAVPPPRDGAWCVIDVPAGSCSVVVTADGRRLRTSWTLV